MRIFSCIFSFMMFSVANAEFEGRYQVGKVFCNVKPGRMATDVRWEKGKGIEYFFFDSDTVYKSSPLKGKPNSFSFTNDNHDFGLFNRADGKIFPVRRVK